MAKLIFGESSIELPSGLSMSEAKELAEQLLPGISDAEGMVNDEGDYVFTKRAGRKG